MKNLPVRMNPEVKKLWLEALRSGEYKQCTTALSDGDGDGGYCCLGVLTDLHRKKNKKGVDSVDWTDGFPSDKVMKWAGLTADKNGSGDNNPVITKGGRNAAEVNDGGASFKSIANMIERNL